jgi:glycosyltransferase involved in cell wall biosynthesis
MIYVFYNNDPCAQDQGGGAEHFRALHRALERAGADYRLIASRIGNGAGHPRVAYVARGAAFPRFFLGTWLWFWRNRKNFRKDDVFHFHRNYAAWPKYLLAPRQGRVVISYHGPTGRVLESRLGPLAKPLRWLMLAFERRAVARADRLVLVRAADREQLQREIASEPFARAIVIPAGFDPGPFEAVPPPTPELATRLLFAGRICRLKNAPLAIAVLEQLVSEGGEHSLTLVGDGEEARALIRRIERSPARSRIRWLGRVPHAAMPDLLARHGIVLVTSLSEASPTIVKEALAAARPVVTTDVGDVRLWIEPGRTGFICPPEVGALTAAVRAAEALLRSGRIRRSERVREVREEVVMARLVELYGELARAS